MTLNEGFPMRVAVLGLGYVGCVTAACLAHEGHQVTGVERQQSKLDAISAGRSPIVEPRMDDIVAAAVDAGRLTVAKDAAAPLREVDVCLVSVGTPSLANGGLDLSQLERVAEEIGAVLAKRETFLAVVFRSTMLPGTLDNVLVPILERVSGKRADQDFGVAMCPEFLRESTAVKDFYEPPFTVVGVRDDKTRGMVQELFAFIDAPFHGVTVTTAESLKYACNAYHAVKVTFANEIARFCASQGVDPRPVMDLFCQDTDLNISARYLKPGFAFGGSCLPKDVRALVHRSRSLDQDLPLLASLLPSNDRHVELAVERVLRAEARTVAMMGLSFKSGTDDLRESPMVTLAERLIGKGVDLRIYDPVVNPATLVGANREYMEKHLPHLVRILADSPAEAAAGTEVVLLATDDEHVLSAVQQAGTQLVIDLHGRLHSSDESGLREAADTYEGLAW